MLERVTPEEYEEIITALYMLKAMRETGTTTYAWNDALRMQGQGIDIKKMGIRLPNATQLASGQQLEALLVKLSRLKHLFVEG